MRRWTLILFNAVIAHADASSFRSLVASLPPSHIQEKFEEWTRTQPNIRNQNLSKYSEEGSLDLAPAEHRGLQAINCTRISNARECCQTGMCSICYGGMVWAFMSYMNWTEEFYKVYDLNVIEEQKVSGNFCGMSWQDCSQLQDLMLFDILNNKTKDLVARYGVQPPQYWEPGHCPYYIYQQLSDGVNAKFSAPALVTTSSAFAVAISSLWG